MQLSVLDIVPLRTDQQTSDAIAVTTTLAQAADRLGYKRYWVAEHHSMSCVASTSPPVLVAHLASLTSRIRLGSGGVILPVHPPFVVAEQFTLLEAIHTGRIDLGIGRASPSDSALAETRYARDRYAETFADDLTDLIEFTRTDRAPDSSTIDGRDVLMATPAPTTAPALWLLGSSEFSAKLAGAKSLPYALAYHIRPLNALNALEAYRSHFTPSDCLREPKVIISVNAVAAESDSESRALMLPNQQMLARQRTGQLLGALDLVEDAALAEIGAKERAVLDSHWDKVIVGTAKKAADQIRSLSDKFGVDEVMISPVASARRGTNPATALARIMTLELLS